MDILGWGRGQYSFYCTRIPSSTSLYMHETQIVFTERQNIIVEIALGRILKT